MLKEWREKFLNIEGVDFEPFQELLLELDDIDLQQEMLEKQVDDLNGIIAEEKAQNERLKERVWKMFEKQTGTDKKEEVEVKAEKEEVEETVKKPEDLIKVED